MEERRRGRLRPSQPSVKPERSRLCASLLQLLDEGCQSRAEAVSTQQGAPPQPEHRRDATPPPMISSFTFCSSFRTSSRISCRADGKQPSGVSSPHACLRPPKVCGSTPQRQLWPVNLLQLASLGGHRGFKHLILQRSFSQATWEPPTGASGEELLSLLPIQPGLPSSRPENGSHRGKWAPR